MNGGLLQLVASWPQFDNYGAANVRRSSHRNVSPCLPKRKIRKVIDSMKISFKKAQNKYELTHCPITLIDFESYHMVILLKCRHLVLYHRNVIKYLIERNECPCCRRQVY